MQRYAARGVKLSLREPLAREDCAIAQSFLLQKMIEKGTLSQKMLDDIKAQQKKG